MDFFIKIGTEFTTDFIFKTAVLLKIRKRTVRFRKTQVTFIDLSQFFFTSFLSYLNLLHFWVCILKSIIKNPTNKIHKDLIRKFCFKF